MTMDGRGGIPVRSEKGTREHCRSLTADRNHISREEIKYYVLHQANERIVEAAGQTVKGADGESSR